MGKLAIIQVVTISSEIEETDFFFGVNNPFIFFQIDPR